MKVIRVLVVDDAVVVRRLISDVLNAEEGIEVVGTAANGHIALAKLDQLNPDLITLDVEMPEMDGLAALTVIRERRPDLPVIMFSTMTGRGAATTMDALMRGANDYVTKPANVGSVAAGQEAVRLQLVPKVRALCGDRGTGARHTVGTASPAATPSTPHAPVVPKQPERPSGMAVAPAAVVIGVSTGGPNALASLFAELPADLGVPILLVQHMPPTFTALLADRLRDNSAFDVREAAGQEPVGRSTAFIAPGGRHLVVERTPAGIMTRLHDEPPENSCRPSVDVLFRSAASVWGRRLLAVVLTGMGHEGLRGCEAVAEAGGHVIVQDRASSVVWGMPGSVAEAGLADSVLPLDQIAAAIVNRVRPPSRRQATLVGGGP